MPVSAISQERESYCRKISQNRFPAGNAGKLLAVNVNRPSITSFFKRESMDMDKPHLVALMPLKKVFCYLKSEFALNLLVKY
jgi:hypothetical protein